MKHNPISEIPVNIQDAISDYRESKKNLERLNSAMATLDKALTNICYSAMLHHEKNYQESLTAFHQLNLPEEQIESMVADKLADYRRSQERMEASTKSLQDLYTAVNVFKKII